MYCDHDHGRRCKKAMAKLIAKTEAKAAKEKATRLVKVLSAKDEVEASSKRVSFASKD